MYTYNLFCFGHQLSKDKQLNNELNEMDAEFTTNIGNTRWELDFPYHGGQVSGDVYSCVFGTIITDDDGNEFYTDEVRLAKEENYIEGYNTFLERLFVRLEEDIDSCEDFKSEFESAVNRLKKFVKDNKPKFYSVQVSS